MRFFKFILASMLIGFSSYADVSPSSVQITIYSVAISPNQDCSNPVLVGQFPGGKVFDFEQNPSIFSGSVSDGTYPCVILQMSDVIAFIPATGDGQSCVAGSQYSASVCRSGSSYIPMTINADNSITYGSVTGCTGNDVVTAFISTLSTGTPGEAFLQPSDSNTGYGLSLNSPFVVSGASAGTFVVDFNNAIGTNSGNCTLDRPSMSFR